MGRRGPGARPKNNVAQLEPVIPEAHPWERPGLSRYMRVVKFIETLPITSGMHAGRKFKLRPWQKKILRAIYRTDRRGRRIVRQALITLPRKQGKTALAAALALCHLLGPEAEQRGQVYSAASDRDQAGIIFSELVAIIEATSWMMARVNIQRFKKMIEDLVNGTIYQALSSDARKAHGLSPSFWIFDELAQARGRDLYDNLLTGQGARAEPLGIIISTQSSDPNHAMSELVAYGQQVNAGIIVDPTFHATIFSAPADSDPWDEQVWRACNPALSDFLSMEDFRTAAAQAKRRPALEMAFRNLRLNQPVDQAAQFLSAADWQGCSEKVDEGQLAGQSCFGGLDLSSTTDLTSFVLYFPHDGSVLPWFWLPGDNLRDREDLDRAPYSLWRKQGYLTTWPGRALDKLGVIKVLAKLAGRYRIQGIAYDRWGMEPLQKLLADEGIRLPLESWGQGYRDMSPALAELERLVLDRKLRHGGHPILNWNASNAVAIMDPSGNRKLDKSRARARIDGLVGLAMAVGLAAKKQEKRPFDVTRAINVVSF